MFAKLAPDNTIAVFPVDLRIEFPWSSWPTDIDNIKDSDIPKGYVRVVDSVKPTGKYITITGETVEKRNGVWTRLWSTKKWLLIDVLNDLKSQVTEYRWGIETGGIQITDLSAAVETTIDSQNRISSILTNAAAAGITEVKFKAASGWVSLPVTGVRLIAVKVSTHVQNCFNAEYDHYQALDAIARKPEAYLNLLAYDIKQAWPSNQY